MVRKMQHFHDRMFALILMLMVGLDAVYAVKNGSIPLAIMGAVFAWLLVTHLKHMFAKYGPHKHDPGMVRLEVQSAKYGNVLTNVQSYHNGPIEPF